MNWDIVLAALSLLGGFIVFTLTSALWISRQFSNTNSLVYKKHEDLKTFIINKLEYHEKHDDDRFYAMSQDINLRFNTLSNDLWTVKLRNATIDGTIVSEARANKL